MCKSKQGIARLAIITIMISCHIHDYVEIACLYHLNIKLDLKSGKTIIGRAITTQYNTVKEECMMLENNNKTIELILTEIVTMSACESNPHFDSVSFL